MKADLFENLPGAELILEGLSDLRKGERRSINALLIGISAPRLRSLGNEVPWSFPEVSEHELYHRLAEEHGDNAHSRYNALIRLRVSFERALDGRIRRELKHQLELGL